MRRSDVSNARLLPERESDRHAAASAVRAEKKPAGYPGDDTRGTRRSRAEKKQSRLRIALTVGLRLCGLDASVANTAQLHVEHRDLEVIAHLGISIAGFGIAPPGST